MRNHRDRNVCLDIVKTSNSETQSLRPFSSWLAVVSLVPFVLGTFHPTLTMAQDTAAQELGSRSFVNVIQLQGIPERSDPPVVTAMSISPDGEWIAAAGDDHAIRIVSIRTGATRTTLQGHTDWVKGLEFSPSGNELASCSNDGTLRRWQLGDAPKLQKTQAAGHALLALSYIDDFQIYTAGFGDNLYLSLKDQPNLSIAHVCECKDVRTIACSPDRQWLAYGGRDGVLRVRRIDNNTGSALSQSPTSLTSNDHADDIASPLHFDRIRTIRFSDDGSQLTSVGEDRRIVHFDIASRTVLGMSEIPGGKLMGLCLLSENLFAIAGSDNSIRLVGKDDQQASIKLVGHDGSVSILRKAGDKLISGSFDTTIRIWDIAEAISDSKTKGRYVHPVAAQFEDSGAGDAIK
jgi:WD40 repeat protein